MVCRDNRGHCTGPPTALPAATASAHERIWVCVWSMRDRATRMALLYKAELGEAGRPQLGPYSSAFEQAPAVLD